MMCKFGTKFYTSVKTTNVGPYTLLPNSSLVEIRRRMTKLCCFNQYNPHFRRAKDRPTLSQRDVDRSSPNLGCT